MPDETPEDKTKCDHETIEHTGGFGDQKGIWESFRCAKCGWTFDLESLDT